MKPAYAVDTSVYFRWWVQQVGWPHAHRIRDSFLDGETQLASPDFVRVELAHTLRTNGLLKGHLDLSEYLAASRSLDDLGVEMVALDADGIERAAAMAARNSLRIYDALAATLALDRGCPLLTADARSARALADVVEIEVLEGVTP